MIERSWKYDFLGPVEMCTDAISHRFISPLQLYLYMKGSCCGKMKIPSAFYTTAGIDLNCTVRTVKNNLRKLLHENWVGHNSRSGYYFVRGFNKIMQVKKFRTKTGAFFCRNYFKNFRGYVAGVCIGYLVRNLKRKDWGRRTKYKAFQSHTAPYLEIATSLISKLLKVSQSTAHALKKAAVAGGFIEVRKNYKQTGVNRLEKKLFKKSFPELSGRVRVKEGNVVLVEIDSIKPLLNFKKRRRSKLPLKF